MVLDRSLSLRDLADGFWGNDVTLEAQTTHRKDNTPRGRVFPEPSS